MQSQYVFAHVHVTLWTNSYKNICYICSFSYLGLAYNYKDIFYPHSRYTNNTVKGTGCDYNEIESGNKQTSLGFII